jgi:hypothetical protein
MYLVNNKTKLLLCIVITVTILIIDVVDGKKKDRNVPHGHYGKLKPYTPGPFGSLKLTKDEISTLEKGQSVMKQIMPDNPNDAGSAICVQDIMAPIQAVWYQILDLDNYTKKVPKLIEHKNYLVKKNNNDGTMTIKTKQVLGVLPGYSVCIFYLLLYCLFWD